ncbi:DUF2938 domain-containing protein [Bordetella genomosp. 11]|uniref:DUF2938 domain-containing protein n=1 Tax=Bordetella genomosp. 11 TaxID=1416808 RepID=A0A261UHB5_9BORD|nr:DUF2938 domain-containing protein [Bordetella genomosp. 11]OZI60610.1 hypothetical protein CAL28_14515 [Bordetella genomosp. 11]
MLPLKLLGHIALIGIGATAIMDAWLWLLARLGVSIASFAMVGRWIGHLAHGQFTHIAIAKAAPVRAELGLGWLTHYVVGIVYAALLVLLQGQTWLREPTLLPPLVFGMFSVVVPWFLMQPAMGAGVLALKTATPLKNCLRNLANHTVFGIGMYAAAIVFAPAAA